MKRRKTIAWILVVLVGLVAISAFIVVSSGQFPYRVYAVLTGSMEPTLSPKTAVLVRKDQYRVGQPISFHEQGGIVTHRFVRMNLDGTITTKGDANSTVDPWTVPPSAVIGGVVASVPQLGYWLMYLRSPVGFASVLVGGLVLWQIWSLTRSSPPEKKPVRARHLELATVTSE